MPFLAPQTVTSSPPRKKKDRKGKKKDRKGKKKNKKSVTEYTTQLHSTVISPTEEITTSAVTQAVTLLMVTTLPSKNANLVPTCFVIVWGLHVIWPGTMTIAYINP